MINDLDDFDIVIVTPHGSWAEVINACGYRLIGTILYKDTAYFLLWILYIAFTTDLLNDR